MSMYRTIARLAVVSAINNFMQQPWPTLAGPNIFDSKIEPVEDMKFDRALPCCVVYTDYDKDGWNKGSKAHADRLMTVTLELLIVQAKQLPDQDGLEVYKLDCPVTDSEIETSLDVFEAQIFRALAAGNEASDAFSYLCPSYSNTVSRRGASVEGGVRLAARQITMEMATIRDNIEGVVPPVIERFFARLEQHDDYADRIDEIRRIMTEPAGWTPGEKVMRAFGYDTALSSILGSPPGPLVLLPQNLTFDYSGIAP